MEFGEIDEFKWAETLLTLEKSIGESNLKYQKYEYKYF
jgi:hypothetical protein